MTGRDVTAECRDMGIIQDDMELGYVAALRATNRQVLLDSIDKIVTGIPENGIYLRVVMQDDREGCNNVIEYKTKEDVPYHSVPCPCGNPKHWLIKYDEE